MDNADLIRTVRGLDQNGPGSNGENLQLLWNLLVANPHDGFHAAEESSLRWLLKSMNGSADAAEKLRRHPITWTILDCVFQRIPLFSLAKSLADRKFVSVLQQTLEDTANPTETTDSSPSSKRKRSTTAVFSIDSLRSQSGCLNTAQALFAALKRLLDRLESTAERFSRDKLGAEHIKSLFCASARDAKDVAAPALRICRDLLGSDLCDQTADCESWVRVISTIWDLRLQGPDDVLQVAEHVFKPAAVILARLGAFETRDQSTIPDSLKQEWLCDLQHFMYRNFTLPGRAAFVNNQDLEAFRTALRRCGDAADLAAPALYFLASSAYKDLARGGLRKENAEWMTHIFQITEETIRDRPDRNSLMQSILEQATEQGSPVSVSDLRRVCQDYCLHDQSTEWSLVAKISHCETDIFQLSDDGIRLRKEVCGRIAKQAHNKDDTAAIEEIIQAMRDGFRTRRDLPGFLHLWFEQLCEIENRKLQDTSPWFKVFHKRTSKKNSLQDTVETEISPQRLQEMIAWVKENSSASNPQALSVFATALAQSVRSEHHVDAVGRQLFDLVDGLKASSPFCALRWRVVSTAGSWVHPSERGEIWSAVKKRLTKTAKKATLLTAEAYEAFKCCSRFWAMFSPDGSHVEEVAALIEVWIQRLSADVASARVLEGTKMTSSVDLGVDAEFDEQFGYQQYLSWILNASSRFSKLYFARADTLPPALTSALSSGKPSIDGMSTLWKGLLCNEINLNEAKLTGHLTNRLIAVLDESPKGGEWFGEKGRMWMQILLRIPMDALDRSQREKVMVMLFKRQLSIKNSTADINMDRWRLILSLCTKIMSRPTFYDELGFSDLVDCSDALSSAMIYCKYGDISILELIERFSAMAAAVLKQMADHVDERSIKYFQGASTFVSDCEKKCIDGKTDGSGLPAFHMTLLRCLAAELSQSTNARSNQSLLSLLKRTRQTLSKCVSDVISLCASDKKLLIGRDTTFAPIILAAVDAASAAASEPSDLTGLKPSAIRKLEKRTKEAMQGGNLRAWKMYAFLQRNLSNAVEVAQPSTFGDLGNMPRGVRESLLKELVDSITGKMDTPSKLGYLQNLLDGFKTGRSTDGQLLAIELVAIQLLAPPDFLLQTKEGFGLSTLHSELTLSLLNQPDHLSPGILCRLLRRLLDQRPQCMTQWNVELTLSTVSNLACPDRAPKSTIPFPSLCHLLHVVIKKHRIRLEGHFHLLLSTMQLLLRHLIAREDTGEASAHLYARLITLICEPTAGAVSRSQLRGALDSATDAAKRSAGRHMYLLLVEYVKLQLEGGVSTEVRHALEPAVNSIFDVTSAEGRKILNDAMDGSGRAILKEMYRRYVRFGKWSGV